MATFSMNVEAQKTSNGKKVLVAYFSRSGNTKAIASHIKELTGGDLFEIQTAKPYPADYHTCTEVAKKEKNDNARPELKEKVKNIEEYDIIFIQIAEYLIGNIYRNNIIMLLNLKIFMSRLE